MRLRTASASVTLIPGVLRVYKRAGYKLRYRIGPWFLCVYAGGGRKQGRRR